MGETLDHKKQNPPLKSILKQAPEDLIKTTERVSKKKKKGLK